MWHWGGCSLELAWTEKAQGLLILFQPPLECRRQKWAGKKYRSAESWISGTGR